MVNIPLFTGFHTCWVVQDFFASTVFTYIYHFDQMSFNMPLDPEGVLLDAVNFDSEVTHFFDVPGSFYSNCLFQND